MGVPKVLSVYCKRRKAEAWGVGHGSSGVARSLVLAGHLQYASPLASRESNNTSACTRFARDRVT